jgi:hypothetical protein
MSKQELSYEDGIEHGIIHATEHFLEHLRYVLTDDNYSKLIKHSQNFLIKTFWNL